MARFIQCLYTNKLIEASEYVRSSTHAIHGDIQSFISPVDGSIISDRKQLREHNIRNDVVNTSEFEGAATNKIRKERERILNGEHTPKEKRARKQEIYNAIIRAERS